MKQLFSALAVAITAAAPVFAGTLGPYTDLVVFGDSTSDSGNAAALGEDFFDGFRFDLYPKGQFSNGDIWATQLGAEPSLLGGTNYAYGSARTLDKGDDIPDLGAQLVSFLTDAPELGSNPLAAISVGGNDFRDFFAAGAGGGDPVAIAKFAEGVITEISTTVATLAATDIKDVLVFALPDLGRLPVLVGSDLSPFVSGVMAEVNAALAVAVTQLDALLAGTKVTLFDLNATNYAVAEDPADFGFTNVTEGCLLVGSACDPDSFFFWDDLHATERANALIASSVSDLINPVPLSAGFPLLLTGLGAFAVMSRRSKSRV